MSLRVEEQNRQIRDERKQQLLLAAAKVCGLRGYAGTKIGDIPKEAGLSHGLVYHYFESKEHLYSEVAEYAFRVSHEAVAQALQGPGGPYVRLHALT